MAGLTSDVAQGSQGTEYVYPQYWEPMVQNASNAVAGLPGLIGQQYSQWYNQPLTAPYNANLQQAWQTAQQGTPWAQGVASGVQAAGGLPQYQQQAMQANQQGSQYDPNKLQQFLNPYTQQAAQAAVTDINRNLNESLMPQVNSTFTGAGQFGSTRNADFANRALRDTQEATAKALATANYGAYDSANKFYSDWANKNLQAGQNMAGLGGQQLNYARTLGDLAQAGQGMYQQDMSNLASTGQNLQQWQQQALDTNYKDWATQQQWPIQQLGALGQFIGNAAGGAKPNVYNSYAQPDTLDKVTGGLGVLSDQSLQDAIKSIFNFS